MGFSQDPRKGTDRSETWTTEKVPGGNTFRAYKAGDAVYVRGHQYKNFKPCTHLLTDGAVPCPCGGSSNQLRWQGYFPVYNEDGKPVVLCVKEYLLETLADIPMFACVMVGRNKGDKQPVWVRQWKGEKGYRSERADRRDPKDIRPWLLILWKIDGLKEYFRLHPDKLNTAKPVAPPAELPAVAVDDADAKEREYLRKLQEESSSDSAGPGAARQLTPTTEYLRGLPVYERLAPATAAKNGKHPPKKPR